MEESIKESIKEPAKEPVKEICQLARITTGRLTLRPLSVEDIPALTEMLRHPLVTKTYMVPDYPGDEAYRVLARTIIGYSRPEDTRHLVYGICLGETLIGYVHSCGFDAACIELGYVIHPLYWGNGYATEMLLAVLEDLKRMGFARVKAGFFEENLASSRVMEKCGMRLSGETGTEQYRGKLYRCVYREKLL